MKRVLAVGLMAASAVTAAHAATVVNGSFDTLSLGGPVTSLGAGTMTVNPIGTTNSYGYLNTTDGLVSGLITSSWNILTGSTTGSITFALSDLVVGQSYQISFLDAASTSVAIDPFTVSYGATQIGSFTPGSTSWTSATTSAFTATNTSGSLTFTGSTVGSGGTARSVGIDAVNISSAGGTAAVPEPATWAMMIGGFGMVGGALRRRRVNTSLA